MLVDGDAFNFIINGTHATSYFIIALIFVIIGCAIILFMKLDELIANGKKLKNEYVSNSAVYNTVPELNRSIKEGNTTIHNNNTKNMSVTALSTDDYVAAGGTMDVTFYSKVLIVYGADIEAEGLAYLNEKYPNKQYTMMQNLKPS